MRPPTDEEMALIVTRAKRLFEAERKRQEEWEVIDDKLRVEYLNRALEQLEREGALSLVRE